MNEMTHLKCLDRTPLPGKRSKHQAVILQSCVGTWGRSSVFVGTWVEKPRGRRNPGSSWAEAEVWLHRVRRP